MARTYAAALTPLRDGGLALDEEAFPPYLDFLHRGGLDGILALGTTGEGILLNTDERMRVAELFLSGALEVIVHCGAQSTLATVQLAEHAAERQAAGVAVIAPPYFPLDDRALLAHLEAAARACEPVPFYVYEFARARGYAVPPPVIERLRERARGEGRRGAARGDRAPARARAEPRRDEGFGRPLGRVRAVSPRRPR